MASPGITHVDSDTNLICHSTGLRGRRIQIPDYTVALSVQSTYGYGVALGVVGHLEGI